MYVNSVPFAAFAVHLKLFFFFFKVLRERTQMGVRGRRGSRLHAEQGAQCGARSPDPQDHDLC